MVSNRQPAHEHAVDSLDSAALPPIRGVPISVEDIFAGVPETPVRAVPGSPADRGNDAAAGQATSSPLSHKLARSPLRGRTQYDLAFERLVKAENGFFLVDAMEKDREEELRSGDAKHRASMLHRVKVAQHVLDQCTTQIQDLERLLDESLDDCLTRSRVELAGMLAAAEANDRIERRDAGPEDAGPSSSTRPGKKRRTI